MHAWSHFVHFFLYTWLLPLPSASSPVCSRLLSFFCGHLLRFLPRVLLVLLGTYRVSHTLCGARRLGTYTKCHVPTVAHTCSDPTCLLGKTAPAQWDEEAKKASLLKPLLLGVYANKPRRSCCCIIRDTELSPLRNGV